MPRTNNSNTFRSLLLVSISAMTLAACSTSENNAMASKSAAPMPPITEMDAAMAAPAPQPLPLSESDTLTPIMAAAPATTETVTTVTSGTPTDAAMEARIAKMEATVNSLRSDYDRIMPAFASLNTTNDRIQKLLDEMEAEGKLPPGTAEKAMSTTTTATTAKAAATAAKMEPPASSVLPPSGTVSKNLPDTTANKIDKGVTNGAAASPVTTATASAALSDNAAAPAEKVPVPSAETSNTVTAVRIGEHGEKTRLVFDLTSKTKPEFKYDLDNGEKVLMVEMPSSAWTAKESGKPNSPLIGGWTAQKGTNGGTEVAIQLKKNARVLSSQFLPAEGKDPARLVMDIASGG